MRVYRMHVHGPTMARNHALGERNPVVCLRPADDLEVAVLVSQAQIDGPSRFVHEPLNPLPNTAGKAVSWVENEPGTRIRVKVTSDSKWVPLTPALVDEIGHRGI